MACVFSGRQHTGERTGCSFLCSGTLSSIRYLLSVTRDQAAWESGRRSAVSRTSVCSQLILLLESPGCWPLGCGRAPARVRMSGDNAPGREWASPHISFSVLCMPCPKCPWPLGRAARCVSTNSFATEEGRVRRSWRHERPDQKLFYGMVLS